VREPRDTVRHDPGGEETLLVDLRRSARDVAIVVVVLIPVTLQASRDPLVGTHERDRANQSDGERAGIEPRDRRRPTGR
jgi:hypothetical protein